MNAAREALRRSVRNGKHIDWQAIAPPRDALERMRLPLWLIRGTGRNGPATLRLRAVDHAEAVSIATARNVTVRDCVLLDQVRP